MNIEEAKKIVDKLSVDSDELWKIPMIPAHKVKALLDTLDKPKPEVPQMIFDVIKSFDDDVDYLHQHMSRQSDEVREWLTHNEREFYEAWLAYPNITIEKEKLYTVEIPNPNSDLKLILVKVINELKLISVYENELEGYSNIRVLTEQEIRKDFDWAWQFAKEVTE
ncbi:TPA: DUF1642 domain-containing protein [Streptococcus agalactiae]|uniref:DUF1642 domain-containing protein n=1 Tax=Streptococcus agalactiae TaxID=1311 RepID=UPI0002D88501|nr:DUF1642 domain-containing protein [Streptococcus agalactiae]EPU26966.1 hypothetical protein SAG0146_00545 [Streptococcus agalactiae MRI Z1-039]KAA9073833.1 DUF1642 domain-containing protein [Streptococcus agalactiae]KAA9102830.1 DUF1642 domain-containing protein [Streptococcus agalactiae]HEN4492116.1 DUF1642 domain-containing protein [Streptococcus agalactiae]HEN5858607.1 DUF1642 domain-containing protein [Streptococcus agalactiae]